ncbi:MAG: glycosyltransferase 87 family protein [Myxococcales bacterium]
MKRAALAVAAAVHLILVVSIARQPFDVNFAHPEARSLIWRVHSATIHRAGPAADFLVMYQVGRQLEAGHSPYGYSAPVAGVPYYYPFRYLPIVAETLGRALTVFRPRTGWLLWIGLLEAVLAAVAVVLARAAPSPTLRWAGPCLLLLSSPYFLELHMGQFSFLTAALFVTALLAISGQGRVREGVAWASYAASALLKVVPIVALPALVRDRRGRRCAAVAVILMVGLSLPLFWAHPDWWRDFAETNLNGGRMAGLDNDNHGFMKVVFLIGQDVGLAWNPARWGLAIRAAQALFLGAASLLAFLAGDAFLIGGTALYLGFTLSYSAVWEHHMSGILVVGLALLWGLAGDAASSASRALAWGALVVLALPTPFFFFDRHPDPRVWDPSGPWPHYALYLMPLSKAGPVLVLYGVALWALWRKVRLQATQG